MIPKTMKAAVLHEFGAPLQIEEVEVKRPGKNEILVKVVACGVCHTDLHAIEGDWPVKPKLPLIPGHEGVGYVVALGPDVENVKVGDAVGVPWLYSSCGHCDYCLTGWETLCETQENSGYSVNGSFAEYVIGDARYVGKLPADTDFFEMAPILCAGVTVYKGLKETETKPGEWVSISGIGGLGHVAVQYAKAMGMNVAAIDISDEKLSLAKNLGADITVNAKNTEPGPYLQKEIGGSHGALITAVSPIAFKQGLEVLRRKGTMALNGLPPGTFDFPIFHAVMNRITVRGSIVGSRKDLKEAIDFAVEGKVKATIHKTKLEDINEVFAKMKAGKIDGRVVIDFTS